MAFNLVDVSRLCIISCGQRKGRTCRKNADSLYANAWPWLVRAHLCPCDNRRSKEAERVIQRKREGEGGLCLRLTPMGKPRANVNNAQAPSRRKLDANNAQPHRVRFVIYCEITWLVSYSLHLCIPPLSWCYSWSHVFVVPFSSSTPDLIFLCLSYYCTTFLIILWSSTKRAKCCSYSMELCNFVKKAPQAVSFFRLC